MEPITELGKSLASGRLFYFSTTCGIWSGNVINRLRTASAHLVTRYHLGPVALQIRAWAWLTAETEDLAEQKRCLEAIVVPDPGPDST